MGCNFLLSLRCLICPPKVKSDALVSSLISRLGLNITNTGLLRIASLICLNAFCALLFYLKVLSFLVKLISGFAILLKSLMKC